MFNTEAHRAELRLRIESLRTQRNILDRRYDAFLATNQEFGGIKLEIKRRALRNLIAIQAQRKSKNEKFHKDIQNLKRKLVQASMETSKSRTLRQAQRNLAKVADAMFPRWAEEVERSRIEQIKHIGELEHDMQARTASAIEYSEKDSDLRALLKNRMKRLQEQGIVAAQEQQEYRQRYHENDVQKSKLTYGTSDVSLHSNQQESNSQMESTVFSTTSSRDKNFIPTYAWQPVPTGTILHPGIEQKLDQLNGNRRLARIPSSWQLKVQVILSDRDVTTTDITVRRDTTDITVRRDTTIRKVVELTSRVCGRTIDAHNSQIEWGDKHQASDSMLTVEEGGYSFFSEKCRIYLNSSVEVQYSEASTPHTASASELPSPDPEIHSYHSPTSVQSKASTTTQTPLSESSNQNVEMSHATPSVLSHGSRTSQVPQTVPKGPRVTLSDKTSPTEQDRIQKRLQDRMMAESMRLETSHDSYHVANSKTSTSHGPSILNALLALFEALEDPDRYSALRGSSYGTIGNGVSNKTVQEASTKLGSSEQSVAIAALTDPSSDSDLVCEVVKYSLQNLLPGSLFSDEFLHELHSHRGDMSHSILDVAEEFVGKPDALWTGTAGGKRKIWERIREHGRYLVRERIITRQKLVGIMLELLKPKPISPAYNVDAISFALSEILQEAFDPNIVGYMSNDDKDNIKTRPRVLSYDDMLGGEPDTGSTTTEPMMLMSSIGLSSSPVKLSMQAKHASSILRKVGAISDDEEDVSMEYGSAAPPVLSSPTRHKTQVRGSMLVMDSDAEDDF